MRFAILWRPIIRPAVALAALAMLTLGTGRGVTFAQAPPLCEGTFTYTGAEQPCMIPANASTITITAIGGAGGLGDSDSGTAGKSDQVQATFNPQLLSGVAGNMLYIEIGGNGGTSTSGTGGFNGGGDGGVGPSGVGAGGGGGASDVRTCSSSTCDATVNNSDTRLVVAGGGAGAGAGPSGTGGNGGNADTNGTAGTINTSGCTTAGQGGDAGTSSSGGAGGPGGYGVGSCTTTGGDGSNGGRVNGGGGGASAGRGGGGGGGGGYFGGGGGGGASRAADGGGGGGGSDFVTSGAAFSTTTSGVSAPPSLTISINLEPQAIFFTSTAPSNAVVGGSYTASANATSGLPVTLTIDPSAISVCSISGTGVVSFTATGTCVIDANQAGNATYFAAPTAQQSVIVPVKQAISFTSTAPSLGIVGGSYTVSATATSGLPVAFTTDGSASSVCSISGATVSFISGGTCVIDANQAGNATYSAAPQVQQSFTIYQLTGGGSCASTFTHMGSEQPCTIPANASTITITAIGGHGGTGYDSIAGGKADSVQATFPVSAGGLVQPGQTLYVDVGGNGGGGAFGFGSTSPAGGAAGSNGGAAGAAAGFGGSSGGGGGGASDVRTASAAFGLSPDRRIVVGGGGGGGGGGNGGSVHAGAGGNAGTVGGDTVGTSPAGGGQPGGSTCCAAGGIAGVEGTAGSPGSLGTGGSGGGGGGSGGGGGGGYYGGGGGGGQIFYAGGGGGGSDFVASVATSSTITPGVNPATFPPSVTISFTLAQTCTLTYTPGPGGTISGTTPQTVNSGASGSPVTATPNPGFTFTSWSDGNTSATRTDSNVTANAAYTASFAPITYTLTYTPGPGGTISGTTPQTVNSGASGSPVTATPNPGFTFTSWSDGNTSATRTDSNVTANAAYTASFAKKPLAAGTTSLSCSPTTVNNGPGATGTQTTSCTATVTDTSGSPTTPSGSVSFSGGNGAFSSSNSCNLSGSGASATCSVTYTPAVTPGTPSRSDTLTATYGADASHAASNGSTTVTVDYVPPTPAVSSISPTSGPAAGGTSVTVTGSGFFGGGSAFTGSVSFGGATAAVAAGATNTSLTVTSPGGSAGPVDITVTTTGGTSAKSSADQFTYVAAPAVTSVAPSSGAGAGGTSVTVTGTGFTGATAVKFGSAGLTAGSCPMPGRGQFCVGSGTSITAISPAQASGTVDVTVTTLGGTSATSSADKFTYVAVDPNNCNGTLSAGPYQNVTVNAGATCTAVSGSAGAITGNLQVQQGGTLIDNGATIDGNLQANQAASITVSGGKITGNLEVAGTTGGPNSLRNAVVGGNVQVQNNSTALPFVIKGLQVTGDLQVQNNAANVAISNNTAGGNIQVQSNTGGGTLNGNTTTPAGGNCQLNNDSPAIVVAAPSPNTVPSGKTNNCVPPGG